MKEWIKNICEQFIHTESERNNLTKEFKLQSELTQKYRDKCEKLQGKLDKASKRYGELIKTISDKSIKSI